MSHKANDIYYENKREMEEEEKSMEKLLIAKQYSEIGMSIAKQIINQSQALKEIGELLRKMADLNDKLADIK